VDAPALRLLLREGSRGLQQAVAPEDPQPLVAYADDLGMILQLKVEKEPTNWPRCREPPRYPSYGEPWCGELATFRCDKCGRFLCTLHTRISRPPAMLELCSNCRAREQAAMVANKVVAQSAAARRRRGPRGRVRAWLARVFGGCPR